MSNSNTADSGTEEDRRTLDLDDYPDGTDSMLGTIHLHGPWDVGNGMPRREVKYTTDLTKSQVRVRAEKLIEDDFLIEERVDVGQAHPEARYRLTGAAREVAAACAESVRMFGNVPEEPGKTEFLEVLSHLSRLRREEGIEEEERSLGTLVERVSALEDRVEYAEDDRKILHSRADKGLEWMASLADVITDTVDGINIGYCSHCGDFADLSGERNHRRVCEDCSL